MNNNEKTPNRFLVSTCNSCQFKDSQEKQKEQCVCLAHLFAYTCSSQIEIVDKLKELYRFDLRTLEDFQPKRPYFIRRNIRRNSKALEVHNNAISLFAIVNSDDPFKDITARVMANRDRADTTGFSAQQLTEMLQNDSDYIKINGESRIIDIGRFINNDVATAYAVAVAWAIMGDTKKKRKLLYALKNYSPNEPPAEISNQIDLPFTFEGRHMNDLVDFISKRMYQNGKPQRCLIIGGGGSGKSTAVNALKNSTIFNFNTQVSLCILELHCFTDEYEKLEQFTANDSLVSDNNKILILDGYDEIPDDKKQNFCDILDKALDEWKCGFIITSRYDIPVLNSLRKYYISPLNKDSIFSLLGIKNNNEEIGRFNSLDERLKELLSTPFFLVKFKSLWTQSGSFGSINCGNTLLNEYYAREIKRCGRKSVLSSDYILNYAIPYAVFSSCMDYSAVTLKKMWLNIRKLHKLFTECDDMAYALAKERTDLPTDSSYPFKLIDEMREMLKIISVDSDTEIITFEHMLIKDYFCAKYIFAILRLGANEKSPETRLEIFRLSGIADKEWSGSVCGFLGEAMNIRQYYSENPLIAAALDCMRGIAAFDIPQISCGYMLQNLINAVLNSQTAMFDGYDFRNIDFEKIKLNGLKFCNCDFRGARGIEYESLLPEGHTGEIIHLEASDDGKTITSIGLDGQRIEWNAFSRKVISDYECNASSVLLLYNERKAEFGNNIKNKLDKFANDNFRNIKFDGLFRYSQLIHHTADIFFAEKSSVIISAADVELFILDEFLNIVSARVVCDEQGALIKPERLVLADDMLFLSSANALYRIDIFVQRDNNEKNFVAYKVFSSYYTITKICLRNYNSQKYIVIGDVCGGICEIAADDTVQNVSVYSSKALWLVSRLIIAEEGNNRFLAVAPTRNAIVVYSKTEDRFERAADIGIKNGEGIVLNNLSCYGDALIISADCGVFSTSVSELLKTNTLDFRECRQIVSEEYLDAVIASEDIVLLNDTQETRVFSLSKGAVITMLHSSVDGKPSISASGRMLLYSYRLASGDIDFRLPIDGRFAEARLVAEDLAECYDEFRLSELLPFVPKFQFLDDNFYDNDECLYLIIIADDISAEQLIVYQISENKGDDRPLYSKGMLGNIVHAVLNPVKGTVLFSNDMGHVFEYYYKTNIMIEFDLGSRYQRTFAYYGTDSKSLLVSRQSKDIISFDLPSTEQVQKQKGCTVLAEYEGHYRYCFDEVRQLSGFAQLVNISGLDFEGCRFDDTLDDDIKHILRQNGVVYGTNAVG